MIPIVKLIIGGADSIHENTTVVLLLAIPCRRHSFMSLRRSIIPLLECVEQTQCSSHLCRHQKIHLHIPCGFGTYVRNVIRFTIILMK